MKTGFLLLSLNFHPIFLGVSLFLRMDILMSFYLAVYVSIFTMYQKNEITITKLILLYLSSIAVLIKGGAGFAVPILIILTFLFLKNYLFLKEIHF